jgi:phage shock protein C
MMSRRTRSSGEPRRNKLYRSDHGMIAGVCAGIAEYFGFDATLTRVVIIVCALFFWPSIIVAYAILAFLLEKRPLDESTRRTAEDPELERRVRSEPHATLHTVRHRFRELDRRMQKLEKHVTSERFKLDREFEGLKS